MRALLFVTSVVLSVGFSAAQAATPSPYTQICDSARLRSVERADCRAQMKAAASDDVRRDVFKTFDRRINGALAQEMPARKADQGNQAQ
ncbi:MAG: hypothetical protein K1X51_10955 [Rhodospirillaceae bacterium]|nr:hypothetical protein [Rhodospirillaceae bacterium]